jgi:hypothetical protein
MLRLSQSNQKAANGFKCIAERTKGKLFKQNAEQKNAQNTSCDIKPLFLYRYIL